jgi:hypothetical protein
MSDEASPEELDPAMSALNERASADSRLREVPLSFRQWTSVEIAEDAELPAETSLTFDIADYRIYLFTGPFDLDYFTRFRHQVEALCWQGRVNFSFVPSQQAPLSMPTFTSWTRRIRRRQSSYWKAGLSGSERYVVALAAYAEELRLWPDELKRFTEERDELARDPRRALNIELDPPKVVRRVFDNLSEAEKASAPILPPPSPS